MNTAGVEEFTQVAVIIGALHLSSLHLPRHRQPEVGRVVGLDNFLLCGREQLTYKRRRERVNLV